MLKAFCIWMRLCTALTGQVTVHDGDTLTVTGVHIRLYGIDAEELSEPHGFEARNALANMVKGGVTCKLTGASSHDRYIGKCYILDGALDVGAEMVRFGYALDCAHYSDGEYRRLEPSGIRTKLSQKPYC